MGLVRISRIDDAFLKAEQIWYSNKFNREYLDKTKEEFFRYRGERRHYSFFLSDSIKFGTPIDPPILNNDFKIPAPVSYLSKENAKRL